MFERYPYRRPSPWQRTAQSGLFGHLGGFLALAALIGGAWFYSDHWYASARPESNVREIAPGAAEMRIDNRVIQYVTAPSSREPVIVRAPAPGDSSAISVSVLDGDTVRFDGATYRLVGFNTPETGRQAQCDSENALGRAATLRLRELVAGGSLDFARVPCACRPGTEGTRDCNYGRLCGTLKSHGRDVGGILIAEGLAHEYTCRGSSCPRRQSWCG